MADDSKTEIIMKFTADDGDVDAECALDVDKKDPLSTGFKPQTYEDYSNFFQVSKFDFGFEIKDEDESKKAVSAGGTSRAAPKLAGRVTGEFASWRSATDRQAREIKYPLEFKQFSFDRLIDAASPVFFDHCVKSKSFKEAVLVKRVARMDTSNTGKDIPWGFLKLVFTSPLIISLSWDDGDMTKESVKFVCRAFNLSYQRQKADSSMAATAVASAKWDAKTSALP